MSQAQRERYNSLHPKLQKIYDDLLLQCEKLRSQQVIDWEPLIVSAHRGKEAQDDAFRRKTTQVRWPNSAHNQIVSLAVDIQGMRGGQLIQGQEAIRICEHIAKLMFTIASRHGIGIRWGGNFKRVDYPHYELSAEWDDIKRNQKKLLTGATK